MKVKQYWLIFFGALLIGSLSGCSEQTERLGHSHHETGYVSWGIDEFELFGLTKEEAAEKFKGRLSLSEEDTAVTFDDGHCGHFHLSFNKDKRIDGVQRVFIDGAGCEIFGPYLGSKRSALEFSINGLTQNEHLDKDDTTKLATARKLLEESN
jgi:hypothetical protein